MNRGKKFFTPVSLAVLLFFGLTVPAHALTTLTSSPLHVGDGLSIHCAIANVGPHPITVTVQVINSVGTVVKEQEDAPTSISPGHAGSLGEPGPITLAYCKFTGNFFRAFVRANAQIRDGGATISVVPAQALGE